MPEFRATRFVVVGAAALLCASPVAAAGPTGVSPGNVGDFASVHTACPTFSWTAVDGSAEYELVVYGIAEELQLTAGSTPGLEAHARLVLRKTIPAGALSWTPSAERCFDMFGSYAWSVRSVDDAGAGAWSESRMFRVDPEPLVRRIGDVLEKALGDYLKERGVPLATGSDLARFVGKALESESAAGVESLTPRPETVSLAGRLATANDLTPAAPLFTDEAELTLVESGTGMTDYTMLQLENPANAIDWAWTVSSDTGNLFLTSPLGTDGIAFVESGFNIVTTVDVLQTLDDVSVGLGGTGELDVQDLTVAALMDSLCVDAAGPSKLGRCASSERYKDGIRDLELGLETVLELRPVSFRWKTEPDVEDFGFVAEEVASVAPLLATFDESGAERGVRYRQMTALLARAIQELSTELDAQNREIEELRALLKR